MKEQKTLANAEMAVMELLWQEDRLTSRAIREQLYANSKKAQHGTVQRLLQRLEIKGFIQCDRTVPVNLFSALISREAYAGSQLEVLTGGAVAPLITHLMEEKKLSQNDIQALRRILDESAEEDEL